MTTLVEGPMASEGSPDEWLSEQASLRQLQTSTSWVEWMEREDRRLQHKVRNDRIKERAAHEREDAEQEAERVRIRQENEAEAAAIRAQTCPSCFCIHAGEC